MPELSNIGILSAFFAGIVSFLSPCVLPLVPGYVSYVAGRSTIASPSGEVSVARSAALGFSLCFVLGFTTVFVILGASATALGQLLLRYRFEMNIVGGGIVTLFGLFMLGTIRPRLMMREARFHLDLPGGKAVSAYVLGLAFAFGWTPCIGPILGAILTVGAASASVADGVALLAIYSLGLGVPFLLAAVFTGALAARLKSFGHLGRILRTFAGSVMILMGVAMMTGYLSSFAFWLLETFPVLSSIG
ncbi:cytochrome c biogenesis CcdA family protein [Hoeflea sp.]|jgi:cytochrome c-type biogenesis protein|uniref:cytochrome c biogenesis CcdA family protein n=1 Tax=Hoeflea sp. TaxID=1940281 RepID=UPI000C3B7D09|nr:cytochrome C biogenesis protein [Hyphomicrobiales bacterium]|tara:strand:+ start:3773 stop:4513 length:741 start_codon:yes stop_codon:yes gene_type:complete